MPRFGPVLFAYDGSPHARAAIEQAGGLLLLGSRGRSTLAATLLGSVSTGVLHHTARPVVIARST